MPQVDQLLGEELLPAEGTLRLGVAPVGYTLPAEQVAAGCGRRMPAFLQAQRAQWVSGNCSFLCMVPAVGQAALQPPLPPGTLPLLEAVELQACGQRQVQQGHQPQQLVAGANPRVLGKRAADTELSETRRTVTCSEGARH